MPNGPFHYKKPFISNNEFCLRIYFIQYLYSHLWSDLLTEYICAFEFSVICTFHFHALEKEMATHSSVLAWRIPWTEKPGRLQPMGLHRVGHDWSDLAAAAVVSVQLDSGFRHLSTFWLKIFFSLSIIKLADKLKR